MVNPGSNRHSTVYSDAQFRSNYPEGIELNFWNLARNRLIADTIVGRCGRDARVFDIGCGSGIVVEGLRNAGLQAEGAELGTPPIKPSLRSFVDTGTDPLEWPEERLKRYDVVIACDVIEHVPDPVGFLRTVRERFVAARYCLVTVPARRELWTNYDEVYGHLLRYDRKTLRGQLAAAGMEAVSIRYAFHGLYPVMGALKLLGRSRITDYKPPKHPRLERLVAGYFAFEQRLVPAFVPGTSVIALATIGRS